MAWTYRSLFVVALGLAFSGAALAQETPPAPKPDAQEAPADAARILGQLEALYPRATRKRPVLDLTAGESARIEHGSRLTEWERAVESFAKLGDDYFAALGGAAPDARALFYRGVGKFAMGERVARSAFVATNEAAAESLQRYVEAAGEKAAFAADAEMYLGQALLRTGRIDDAVVHLARAVELLQKDGRHDDAGVSAYEAMVALKSQHRDADLRVLCETIHAAKADFGTSTSNIRKLAAGARLAVGAPLPPLPETKDVDGKAISWSPGKPLLIHFFLSGHMHGAPTAFREIEIELRPLAAEYGAKGLALAGVSMDYAIPAEKAEELRKKFDEWGRKEFRDGSLSSVRDWVSKTGITWPWAWDGQATKNPVSLALGGVGVTEPYAVLVDAKGVVRWHGKAPFEGLAAEVAKLFP